MNEKALMYVIFFIGMIILTRLTGRWLYSRIYLSAGVKWEEVMEYLTERRGFKNKRLLPWLISQSPDPAKTRRAALLYYLASAPAIICLAVAVTGLSTHFFDRFLDCACYVVLAITFGIAIMGTVHNFRSK